MWKTGHLRDRAQLWKGREQLLTHTLACLCHNPRHSTFTPTRKSLITQPRELTENINTIYIFLGSVLSHSLHFVLLYVCTYMHAHRLQNSVSVLKSWSYRELLGTELRFSALHFWFLRPVSIQSSGSILRLHKCWDKMCVLSYLPH